jgi:hypothetical protein
MKFWLLGDGSVGGNHDIVSLSSGQVIAEGESHWKWAARPSGSIFRPLPEAPTGADFAEARLTEMKDIMKRFSAAEKWGGERRLTVRPEHIHRYSDPQAAVVDGAIFCLVADTNPELVVLIELQGKNACHGVWHYALARLGAAEMWVNLDGREVWRCHPSNGGPSEEYWYFRVPYAPPPQKGGEGKTDSSPGR